MKLRLLPVILTVLITSCICFGGWYAYRSLMVENPLQAVAADVSGVVGSDVAVNGGLLHVRLTLGPGADWSEAYRAVYDRSVELAGKRAVRVTIESESTDQLDRVWSEALFDVAEAMETSRYTSIPAKLEELAGPDGTMTVQADIDDLNVYVQLRDGSNSKYIVLPRIAPRLEVWDNDQV